MDIEIRGKWRFRLKSHKGKIIKVEKEVKIIIRLLDRNKNIVLPKVNGSKTHNAIFIIQFLYLEDTSFLLSTTKKNEVLSYPR